MCVCGGEGVGGSGDGGRFSLVAGCELKHHREHMDTMRTRAHEYGCECDCEHASTRTYGLNEAAAS